MKWAECNQPEDVEEVKYGQDSRHIAGGEQCCQVFHRAVEVTCETVLDQQRREL